jgi:DNA-binding MarR family transcriptional regulator
MARTETARRRGSDEAQPAAAAPVRLGPLAEFIGFHLRLAQEVSFQAFARRVGEVDVRPGRFALLMLIGENPGISQTALGRAGGRDKSTLTPALDDLQRRGLIRRERLSSDRRTYALRLTEAGAAVLGELTEHARAHDRELDRIVGREEKARFLRTLRRIAIALGSGDRRGEEEAGDD